MKSRIQSIEIEKDNPFANCKLGREKYAQLLKAIVSQYNDGCVMALKGKWGTGKTTFVKMWQQYMQDHGFKTIYLNAWENDFMEDPMIEFLGELKELSSRNNKSFKKIISAAGKIAVATVGGLAKGFLESRIGCNTMNSISEGIKDGVDETQNLLQKRIDEYNNQKVGLVEFRKCLSNYIESQSNGKPVVFIVDELDRCNPHYAVKVLERIKHLFDIPNIFFVLSIDKQQLAHSICGFYGSDKIDATEYLKRFIDIEYELPEPDYDLFVQYVCEQYEIENVGYSLLYSAFKNEYVNIQEFINDFTRAKNLSLRQIERWLSNFAVIMKMNCFPYQVYYSDAILYMLYLKIFDSETYGILKKHSLGKQDLVDRLESVLKSESPDSINRMTILAAKILKIYFADSNEQLLQYESKTAENNEVFFRLTYFDKKYMTKILSNIGNVNITMPKVCEIIELFIGFKTE